MRVGGVFTSRWRDRGKPSVARREKKTPREQKEEGRKEGWMDEISMLEKWTEGPGREVEGARERTRRIEGGRREMNEGERSRISLSLSLSGSGAPRNANAITTRCAV